MAEILNFSSFQHKEEEKKSYRSVSYKKFHKIDKMTTFLRKLRKKSNWSRKKLQIEPKKAKFLNGFKFSSQKQRFSVPVTSFF